MIVCLDISWLDKDSTWSFQKFLAIYFILLFDASLTNLVVQCKQNK